MSILFYVLAFLACVITAAGGAWLMRWHIQRNTSAVVQEDPRDTEIRNLMAQVRLAKTDKERSKKGSQEAEEQLKQAHERIDELAARCARLSDRADSTETDLKEVHSNKDLLREKLSVASQQLDSLKQRNQELEVELSVTRKADMLEATPAEAPVHAEEEDEIDRLGAITTPDVAKTTGSLLHSLTEELERWKRHCHVLGDELKLQRERLAQMGETTDSDENPFDSIDELTDIRGIGNVIARKLHQLGIYRYKELAALTDDDLERAQMLIPDFQRRMNRDQWQDQARSLHYNKYQEPI